MDQDNYLRSQPYEQFICAARLCGRENFNAHNCYMQNLLNADEGKNHTPHSYAKLLAKVKTSMTGATHHALKRHLPKDEKTALFGFLKRINLARSGAALLIICKEGAALLIE